MPLSGVRKSVTHGLKSSPCPATRCSCDPPRLHGPVRRPWPRNRPSSIHHLLGEASILEDTGQPSWQTAEGCVAVSRLSGPRSPRSASYHRDRESRNNPRNSSAPAGRGDSLVTRCWGKVPSTNLSTSSGP